MENSNLSTVKNPKALESEAYRTLRTNIQFSSIVDKKTQVILVTSAGPREGKSTIAANLAVVMAQSKSKTLIIDCDQRKPSIHKIFGVSNIYGLSDLLTNEDNLESAISYSGIENLQILTSGTNSLNPTELLTSKKMSEIINSLRDKYDYIILDTPPILAVADAQVISRYSDGCLLVVSSGEAERDDIIKAKELLRTVNSNILGVVLNKIKVNIRGYYKAYYYYEGRRHKRKNKEASKSTVSYI